MVGENRLGEVAAIVSRFRRADPADQLAGDNQRSGRAVELLQQNGMRFFVAFSASDFSARLAAVAAGLGVLAVSVRNVIPGIEIMHEGMPELPENKAGIFVREGLDYQRLMPLLQDLIAMLAPQPLPELLPVEEPARPAPLRRVG